MGDDDEKEEEAFSDDSTPPTEWMTLSLGHHCLKHRQLTDLSSYPLPTLIRKWAS